MIQRLLFFLYCIFLPFIIIGQGSVCSDSKYEVGGFNLSSPEICVGSPLTVINQSSGTDIKYVFDYNGQNLETATALASNNIAFTYTLANTFPNQPFQKEITILQLGKKNGKTMAACKKVIVRSSNEPIMSWDVCGLNLLEIVIPTHPLNDYDTYDINFGPGFPPVTITKAELPYKTNKTLPTPTPPRNISITGKYTIRPQTCPNVKQILVSNIPATITRPYHANIDRLELITKSKAEITFIGSYSVAPTDYTLYGYLKGNHLISPKPIEIRNITENRKIEVAIPDPTKIYCFYAQRTKSCGVVEKSIEICTHPLVSVVSPPNATTTTLNWNPYDNTRMFGLAHNHGNQQRYFRTKLDNPPVTASQVKAVGASNHIDQNSTAANGYDCKFRNCYRVEMNLSGRIPGTQIPYKAVSVSNTECSDRFNIVPPGISKLWVGAEYSSSGVPDENFKVDFLPATNRPWAVPKNRWVLYRMESGLPVRLDSSAATQAYVKDPRAPKEATEYKIGYVDRCESRSTLSPSVYSVYLDYKGGSTIFWTQNSPFNFGGILNYEVVSLNDTTYAELPNPKKIQKGTYKDIVSLGDAKDAAPFYVKIYSDSTLVSFVRSNITKIPVALNFYAPTAFSPNNDGKNDEFGIFGPKAKIDQFSFRVFDRLGNLLFETNDKNKSWDGTVKNKPAALGTYSWRMTIKLKTGIIFNKSGTVQLLR